MNSVRKIQNLSVVKAAHSFLFCILSQSLQTVEIRICGIYCTAGKARYKTEDHLKPRRSRGENGPKSISSPAVQCDAYAIVGKEEKPTLHNPPIVRKEMLTCLRFLIPFLISSYTVWIRGCSRTTNIMSYLTIAVVE